MQAPRFPHAPRLLAATLLLAGAIAQAQGAPAAGDIQRGQYLARAGDCVSCHTAPGGKPFAGGAAIQTGFGAVYPPNITPDRDTGIGSWSAEDFYRAMHTGHDDEGHHLYPAFPYPWFTRVTRADVAAIKAYLDTVPPVHQANRPPQLAWFARWRPLLAGWNLLNFQEGEFKPNSARSPQWNRGAYLVEGLGHCGACHTAKGPLGGTRDKLHLQGSTLPEGWFANGLAANARHGLGDWSEQEIVEYLKTGSTAHTAPAGPMSEVIANSTSHLTDGDLHAIATYLKDLPAPAPQEARLPVLGHDRLQRGQALFVDQCAGCHMVDGGGVAGVFPALAGSSAIQAAHPDTLLRVVLQGQRIVTTAAKPTGISMPAFAWKLDDQQVADVVSYIRNAWGNSASAVESKDVAQARRKLAQDSAAR